MANKKSTCTNCERPDLNIANAKGHCHTCHAAGKDLEGEELRVALVNVKFRLQAKADGIGRPDLEPAQPGTETLSPASKIRHSISVDRLKAKYNPSKEKGMMTLLFEDEIDMRIFDYIESEAKRCRRTPDQQTLFMLQSHLPESREYQQRSVAAP